MVTRWQTHDGRLILAHTLAACGQECKLCRPPGSTFCVEVCKRDFESGCGAVQQGSSLRLW